MAAGRDKAQFKARRIIWKGQPAWAICWYHYCHYPIDRKLSRYSSIVLYDDGLVSKHYTPLAFMFQCRCCLARKQVTVSMLQPMYDEAVITTQLQAVTRCK